MASLISTKSNQFRYASRILCSHILRSGRSITLSPPFSNHLHHSSLPLHQVELQGYGNRPLSLCQRFLSSTAAGNVNQEKPASDSSAKDNSGQEKESGQSNQKSDEGKPVRGGPVSWLSFLLLVVTGAGLILYYDKEKK